MSRFDSRETVRSKVEWEGGITDALEYGLRARDMPERDTELIEAWARLEGAFRQLTDASDDVERLLYDD